MKSFLITVLMFSLFWYSDAETPIESNSKIEYSNQPQQEQAWFVGWVNRQGSWTKITLVFRFDYNGRAKLSKSQLDGYQMVTEYGQNAQPLNPQHKMAINNNMTHMVSTSSGTAYFSEYDGY